MLDGVGYFAGDIGLAVLITFAALMTYARIAFERRQKYVVARMAAGVGFTIWAIRFWWTLAVGGDVIVAPVSMIAITLVCSGYSAVQTMAIRRVLQYESQPVYCLQKPEFRCHREDRIRRALEDGFE